MNKKLLITSLALTLPLFSCNGQQRQEEGQEVGIQEEQVETERALTEGKVIEREESAVQKEAAKLEDKTIREGSEEVEYTTQQEVTKTILHEENIPTIEVCESKGDINKMDKEAFTALGFDPKAADQIVKQREQQGEFKSVEDLSQVQGISQSKLAEVKQDLGVAQKQAEEAKQK